MFCPRYELTGCEVIWVIKDDAIGNAYFDKGAAQFFLPALEDDAKFHEGKIVKKEMESAQNSYDLSEGNNTACKFQISYMYIILFEEPLI